MKKYGEYLEESLADVVKSEPKTNAAKEARKMGLTYLGFGRYADRKGNVAYIVVNDKLVPYKKEEEGWKLQDKAVYAKNPEQRKELGKQANQIFTARKKTSSQDRKILQMNQREAKNFDKELKKFYPPTLFNPTEMEAIEYYTSEGYEAMNRYLYKGHDDGADPNGASYVENMINALDSAFDEAQAPFPYTVYTGLSDRYRPEKIQPGMEYISSSLDYMVSAESFTDSRDGGVVLQIDVQQGQKALHIGNLSSVEGEMETLLPRGSKVQIISGPHFIPRNAMTGVNYDDEEGSGINLFHCVLVQDS